MSLTASAPNIFPTWPLQRRPPLHPHPPSTTQASSTLLHTLLLFLSSSTSRSRVQSLVSPYSSLLFFHILTSFTDYVVDCVVDTVDYAMGRPSSSKRGRSPMHRPEHAKFLTFVTNVITRAEITTPTILAALVYIDRARPHLHIALEEWALERVFLGAIIVASKVCSHSFTLFSDDS